jgi:TonB-linked SusC/RagA family outer membrane protein
MKRNRFSRVTLFLLPLLMFPFWCFGQDAVIRGTVLDETGAPLIGANVSIMGTTYGTVTDVDGNYQLEAAPESTIVFSYMGYLSRSVLIGEQRVINITLMPDVLELGDVVVVGYGVQRKVTMTGSVSKVEGTELVKSPSPNVSSTLAGRLPGLIVNQRSGEPGRDDPSILIRGHGTFRDNQPLVIIDGVERGFMGRLNPEDIESISVLKDASAAIYGSRGANGVILITTKSGTAGKPEFNFSVNSAFQRPTKIPEVLDAATFAEVFNEAEWYRAGRPETWSSFYPEDAIRKFRDGSDPVLYPNTNWTNELLKPYSMQQRVNLSANGGTEGVRYYMSFGSTYQDGIFRNDPTEYQQYNMRLRVDANLNDNLSIGANISAILNDRNYSTVATDDEAWINFVNVYLANPTLPARYPNGLIAPGRLGENPLLLDQRGYFNRGDQPLFSTFTATYKIPFVEGLKLEGSYNYDLNNQIEKRWRLPYYYHEYNVVTQQYDRKQGTGSSTVELWDTHRRWTTSVYNLRANYDRIFDMHRIGIMVGTEQQQNTYRWLSAYRKNFVSPAIDQISVGSNDPDDKNNGGNATMGGYNNYFGRVNYNFAEKYLLEFLFRRDGSQKFAEGRRYGFFPGVSAGWRLSEENFILDNFTFVNELKLRASWGQMGNDRVAAFQHYQTFGFGNNFVFGGSEVPGIFPRTMPNPLITWETAEKADVGLDALLWRGMLGIDFTYWTEQRRDILAQRNVSVSQVYGFSGLPDENIGEVNNHGFEVILSHRNNLGDLNYRVSANTSFARSRVVFMDEVPQAEPYMSATGKPVFAGLFYQADGIFNTQEELDAYPSLPNAQVGDIKIVDLNGDGVINNQDQFRFDYTAIPEYVFGMTFDLQYRNFDLNLFIQGQTNAYNYDWGYNALGNEAFDNATVHRATDRWTIENPYGTMPRAGNQAPGNNTMWLFDATFVRLKTLELGYSLPQELVSRIGLNNARFYVSGFNLLTWAKEIKWADPEGSGDLMNYPQQRVINLGINVNF